MLKANKKEVILLFFFLVLSFFSGYLGGKISYKNNLQEVINKVKLNNEKIKNDMVSEPREKINQQYKADSIPLAAKIAVPTVVNISLGGKNMSSFVFKNSAAGIYKPLEKKYFSLGSGVIVSRDGYILTNNHVVENLSGHINVNLSNGNKYKAEIVGTDPKTDLAVIKIDADNLPAIKFSNSDKAAVGDMVIAIGNPFGIGETVTMGIISATGRSNIGIVEYENFIQTDAAINPGSSGGALVSTKGELVGINTAILTKSGGYEGIGFAIPSNMAKKVYKNIMEHGRVERGWIGIGMQDINIDDATHFLKKIVKGAMVIEVIKGSPAYVSGLQKGDVIISIDKQKIKGKNQVINDIAETSIGKEIRIEVLRRGKSEILSVKISKLPDNLELFDVNNLTFPARCK